MDCQKFAKYCEKQFNMKDTLNYGYQSLSVCMIDCIYSLRAKYYAVTVPIVQRYADLYMNGDPYAPGDTVSLFLQHIAEQGGTQAFAEKVLKNHQLLGGIPKEDVCYQLAKYLQYLHIDTSEDFRKFETPALLETVIHSVKGIGTAGVSYLFMLAGDPDRCKPDVHIHHCIRDALGYDISDQACQTLFTETVSLLQKQYPTLTVRQLDGIIWKHYQSQKT